MVAIFSYLWMLEYEVCLAEEEGEMDIVWPDKTRIQTRCFLLIITLDLLQQQAVVHHVPQTENCKEMPICCPDLYYVKMHIRINWLVDPSFFVEELLNQVDKPFCPMSKDMSGYP